MTRTRRNFIRGLGGMLLTSAFNRKAGAQKLESNPELEKSTVVAIQAFMDTKTELRVRAVWQRLAQAGITDNLLRGGSRPHITLASWSVSQDPQELVDDLHRTARALSPITATLRLNDNQPSQGGVYLLPSTEDQELFNFHTEVHRIFATPGKPFRQKDLPGQWWPHLSVAYGFDLNRLEEAFEICSDLKSVEARIEYLGLVTFGPIRYPAVFELNPNRSLGES